MTNEINQQVQLKAPLARVWRALTDHAQFGAWFGVRLAAPFVIGQAARGTITHPGDARVRESGFDQIPSARRAEAFLRNEGGWTIQMDHIAAYVDGQR